ncbi:MAG TPA: bifunctional diguanylate cyclase/phosphodiesterase [Solirubrobacteraceae bacterium]|jgi:diguanylate cyclase (GGDEF)-like protein|nr:bifunctional diguanylate cyclase/phosphodiesterase [Solirubrobacteraceae bacterium]
MGLRLAPPRSAVRLFAVYAVISLVPVLVLGLVLALSLRGEARQRGLVEGRSEAALVAQTAVAPLLDGRPLSRGVTATERTQLQKLAAQAIGQRKLLRLRIRDLTGQVVFSDDGSGLQARPEEEALSAAHGVVVARLTRVNADSNDNGHSGNSTVEVYMPLAAGSTPHRVGVLELYLPYAPISRDVTAGLHGLYIDLALGLAMLYLALFAITWSVSRGLRREVKLNAFLAEHDVLTELPNRMLFHRRAGAAVALGARRSEPVAIAIIDLDHFKDINDTLGHHNGDRLLAELARRVAGNTRPGDTVARLGGDEFGLVLRDAAGAETALHRLREIIDEEIEVSGLPLSVEASIGFVVAPDDGTDVDTLIQRADVAMYFAKAQHSGVMRYDPALDDYDAGKLSLVGELRHAIDAGELVLHYQPQSTLADGRIEAVEALVRWQHPTHGLLPPDRFLPLAEQTDVIDKLTHWVLRTALCEIRDLPAPADELTVAVNVSARSIGRIELASTIVEMLADLDVPAERLVIEVTETALLADPERAPTVLGELAAAGVKVSLDDFGSGQTSLGYLSALPIHELKIDKSFVLDMIENPAHAAIVRSIVDLGHNLALRVVGEGVETDVVLGALRESECDVAQGYLLARPMDVPQLGAWLAPRLRARTIA